MCFFLLLIPDVKDGLLDFLSFLVTSLGRSLLSSKVTAAKVRFSSLVQANSSLFEYGAFNSQADNKARLDNKSDG